jgi:hypothetical protein
MLDLGGLMLSSISKLLKPPTPSLVECKSVQLKTGRPETQSWSPSSQKNQANQIEDNRQHVTQENHCVRRLYDGASKVLDTL